MEYISLNPTIKPVGSATTQSGNRGQQLFQPSPGQILKATVIDSLGGDRFILEIGAEQMSARSEAPLDVGQQLRLEVLKTTPQVELKIIAEVADSVNKYLGKSVSLLGKNIDLSTLVSTIRQQPANVTSLLSPPSQLTIENFLSLQQNSVGSLLSSQQTFTAPPLASSQTSLENAFALQQFAIDKILFSSQATPGSFLAPPQTTVIENFLALQQFTINKVLYSPQTASENVLSTIQSSLAGKDGGESLKQMIDNLGLNLENLLAKGDTERGAHTLKAALLDVLQTFGKTEAISETTTKLLTTIEAFQFAQLQLGSQSIFILPLPLPFIEQGYLLVESFPHEDSDGEHSAGNEESRFSLHLSLTEFGRLRIDFLKNKEGLFIRFHTDNQEKTKFLETFDNELKESITGVSFVKISYSSDAEDPVGELLRLLAPESGSMFDTQI